MAQEDDYSFKSSTFSSSLKYHESRPDIIWQELEKDIEKDFAQNIEEEFARIRQSLELNEADFLELKDDLQLLNSPIAEEPTMFVNSFRDAQIGNGFGKSIEEDWENFEKLSPHPEGIQVAYDEKQQTNGNAATVTPTPPTTVSILKETKNDGPPTAKPRKSKVTFDSKTEERYIPARKSVSDEDDSDDDENYSSPPIPSQRYQTRLNYGQENSADPIPLFGSISNNDQMEDSWSAIRKHRHMTEQFQMLSLDSNSSPPPPSYPPPPLPREEDDEDESDDDDEVIETPKPAYRNPMALLAAQRAKEARNDLGEFKGRSIKDAQKKRTSPEFVNLNDRFDDTEA
uniref:Centromere protein B dimerization protein n=1 Tax=Musca domestica TaxID=7370 RepID=T1PKK2_MUSDO